MSVKLRPDLQATSLDEHDERNSVILKDPVSGKFYRLSTYEYTFLQGLDGRRSPEEVVELLRNRGHFYTKEDAGTIIQSAERLGLVLGSRVNTAAFQLHMRERIKKVKRERLFAEVFFLFLPLVNPDRFLEKTLWLFKALYNKWSARLLAVGLVGAIWLFIDGLGRLNGQYLFFFNLENLLYLWVAIALTKFFHELAHAYTAKGFGLYVPQMGVAFLIFFPCLFCNTTEAWRLAGRRQRIAIGAAGIVAELALAVVSTYVWYFTKPGMLNSLAFYFMTVASISTILFNGNPLIRFDGYYVLSDLLRIPNLMTKSRGFVKYLFLNRALGLENIPNPAQTGRERFIFSFHGVAAFIYRFFLYTGIVAGVYYRFDKLVGIVLAVLAIAMFIVLPILKGLKNLYHRRKEMKPGFRGMAVLVAIILCGGVLLFVPLSRTTVYSCYLTASQVQKLTVPLLTSITEVSVREGSAVKEGTVLFGLDTSELELAVMKKRLQLEILQRELDLTAVDEVDRAQVGVKRSELRKAEQDLEYISREMALARKGVAAPFDGVVTNLDHRVQKGFQPGEGVVVGELKSTSKVAAYALVNEEDLAGVHVGQEVEIWFPVGTGILFTGNIDTIRQYSEKNLADSPFSSRFGGEIATEPKTQQAQDVPIEPVYLCGVHLSENPNNIPLGITGKLVVPRPPKSLVAMLLDNTVRTFNRESLF